ncbi:Pentatricopeptide repeat-containing protein [Quillaja saponaria]|uniref:Pentatricopeptide repeat-containing protein n=1 Tax=Quillaja saponaria TaxID=32244 RepID=A0AAD7KYZ5_QUISA|nr:Pentatricopeptide repeat-containing protein [Quillaja saponaria]
MLVLSGSKFRFLSLIPNPLSEPLLSYFYTRSFSFSSHKGKTISWNTTHIFVQRNPLLSLLEKCKSLFQLKQIQAQMILTGLISDGFSSSRLIAFCAISDSRDLDYCTKILYNMQSINSFSYNVTIRGFLECENPKEAFLLYKQMLQDGRSRPDNHTYPLLLKACSYSSLSSASLGIVGHVLKSGFGSDLFVRNALIHMLLSCGKLEAAYHVFDEGCVRDLVTWNSMINGCVKRGLANEALNLYQEMEVENVRPNEVTMIGVISSCAQLEDLNLGKKFHWYVEENGLNLTVPLSNALMDMYVKCGDLVAAQILFDNMTERTIVSWTTLILGYSRQGFVDVARKLLCEIPEKNVVPWNAIIGGCVHAKRSKEALTLFHEMQASNIRPDEITMINCLSACSQLGALDVGIWAHHYIKKHNLLIGVALGTALIDMYAKCGNIPKALQVFHEMPQTNSLTWTAVICGLALHGSAHDAIFYFSEMIHIGLMPDEITFLGVLSACCHGGLVEEGRKYFSQMSSKYNLRIKLKHYSCMVDLLGRAGLLEEAEKLVRNMPMEADVVTWGALFFACRIHGNVVVGEWAASKLLELDPEDSGIYILLSSMYGEANMWEEARNARKMMNERGVEKTPGCSSIEVNGIIHEFTVRDKSHPQSEQVHECLLQLTRELQLVGCISSFLVD